VPSLTDSFRTLFFTVPELGTNPVAVGLEYLGGLGVGVLVVYVERVQFAVHGERGFTAAEGAHEGAMARELGLFLDAVVPELGETTLAELAYTLTGPGKPFTGVAPIGNTGTWDLAPVLAGVRVAYDLFLSTGTLHSLK